MGTNVVKSEDCFFILEDFFEYKIKFANKPFLDLLGFDEVDKLTDLLSIKEQRDLVAVTLSKKSSFDFRCVLMANDRYIGALLRFSVVADTIYCHIEDYENDLNYIKRLQFENDRLSALIELTGTMMAEFDTDGKLTYATGSVVNRFDINLLQGGIVSSAFKGLIFREDRSKFVDFIKQPFLSSKTKTCELRLLCNDLYYWHKITAMGIFDSRGNLTRVLVKAEDIEAYKAKESVLKMKLSMDDLTKCYKKSFLVSQLSDVEVKGCLAFFDIDNFKGINDTYGHLNGDVALKSVAKICREVFSDDGDIVCRFGGDEFCIYSRFSSRDVFEYKIQLVQSRVTKIRIENCYPLSISVGIVVASDNLSYIQDLLDIADETLYFVKENGKNSYKFFDE